MSSSFPSIQSFYQREVAPSTAAESSTSRAGDGFTTSEVSAALHPLSFPWVPSREYDKCPILLLQTGPRYYEITGRILNLSATTHLVQSEEVTKYQRLMIVSDGTGAIAVRDLVLSKIQHVSSDFESDTKIKLHYSTPFESCQSLGQRVTIYSTYIADPTRAESAFIPFVICTTTLYPGRNGATHIIFHQDSLSSDNHQTYRVPLGLDLKQNSGLPGLMSLKSFLSGGYDMGDGNILVCVRSIGPRKTVHPRKREGTVDLVEVGIFDDTASTTLNLWGDYVFSARSFVPNQTILLISSPSCRGFDRSAANPPALYVTIGYSSLTLVQVDPSFAEADWLRKKIKDMSKSKSIMAIPEEAFNLEVSAEGPIQELFTLAEVDEMARQDLDREFTGTLNVLIVEMKLMDNWRKGSVCRFECCEILQYANKPLAWCKSCGSQRELFLNPQIIGILVDESGSISSEKIIWKDSAWTQLLFGNSGQTQSDANDDTTNFGDQSWESLTALDNNSLRDIEDQLLYSRTTLTFCWSPALARICILAVEW